MTPRDAFQRAVRAALFEVGRLSASGTGQGRAVRGQPIPDHLLPGRFLQRILTVDEYKAIIFLKSEDTWVRPDAGPGHIRNGVL